MKCECDGPGFCKKHDCFKNQELYEQCKACPLCFAVLEKQEPIIGPSLPRKIMNYAVAEVRHTLSGRKEVTNEVFEKRMKICESCPLFEATKKVCLHQDCGCFLEIKAKWADSECPIGNWGKSSNDIAVGCGSCGSATAKS